MELDWSTFFLELINFLVLVWLLKRFLYRPVLEFVARRRAETEEAMAKARRDEEEAAELKRQYENRLEQWAKEREAARVQLHRDLDRERAKRLDEIRRVVEEEREKARVADERRAQEFRETAEREALALGARFASRLLTRLSVPESTAALADVVAEEIAALPAARRETLRRASGEPGHRGAIEVAHPLDGGRRRAIEAALADLFGADTTWEWKTVPGLVAGVRITFGAWVLAANLRDELHDFTQLSHD